MPIEFCHLCRTATNMITTVTPRTSVDKDGKMKTMSIKTYYCESRSERIPRSLLRG